MNAPQHLGAKLADQASKPGTEIETLERVFEKQTLAFQATPYPSYQERMGNLKKLYQIFKEHEADFVEALNEDFQCRSRMESQISEMVGSYSSIRYQMRHLKKAMKPQRRSTSIWYLPASCHVVNQPLGVVGIMAPWNYSLHLTVAPIAAALAAGNRVMAKMSELTPATAACFKKIVAERFSADTLAIVDGEMEISQHFSQLPFNHLLFTGSTSVGRHIAQAAAKNLTPVTLELSGKSPVVIGENYPVDEAALRTMWGKSFNAGQTCIAPDYVLVPEAQINAFKAAAKQAVQSFYPKGIDNDDYTSVINARHYARIQSLMNNAAEHGAEVIPLIEVDEAKLAQKNKIPPTLVINPSEESDISGHEVFGPALAVYTYDSLDSAEKIINRNPDPLALFIFSKQKSETVRLRQNIKAGTVAVNETLLQYLQNDLPFGGVGNSGSGKYHGPEGFKTFSNHQAVFKQAGLGNFTGMKLMYPPYGKLTRLMIKLLKLWP